MITNKNEDALILFSGGQDSTTSLFWAKKKFKNVHALCIGYGQRHEQELSIAEEIAKQAGVSFQTIDASLITQLAPNSLTHHEIEIDRKKPAGSYPNTFVPGRNMLFLTFAASIAYAKNIRHIITGVSEADYSGYPDCREEFIRSVNESLNLAMDKNFLIHTPLMHLNKAAVWKLSDDLGVFDLVKRQTLTCYNGIVADGCGDCPACTLRREGLKEYMLSLES